ncbi:hypothetical protein EDD21DRAFT_393483 [Dissophora ornata]|nr:hypothetical protein EDD21DRAFT_393483 [Dissophora ornata]
MAPTPLPFPDWLRITLKRPEDRQEDGSLLLNVFFQCAGERIYAKVQMESKGIAKRSAHPLYVFAMELLQENKEFMDLSVKGHFKVSPYQGERGMALTIRMVIMEAKKAESVSQEGDDEEDLFDNLPVKVYDRKGKNVAKHILSVFIPTSTKRPFAEGSSSRAAHKSRVQDCDDERSASQWSRWNLENQKTESAEDGNKPKSGEDYDSEGSGGGNDSENSGLDAEKDVLKKAGRGGARPGAGRPRKTI